MYKKLTVLIVCIIALITVVILNQIQNSNHDQVNSGQYFAGITNRMGQVELYPYIHAKPGEVISTFVAIGATNQNITQANISQTICNPHWSTKSIRPSVSYTNKLKIQQIAQYGYEDTDPSHYEEDHLISLELGGSPTDPHNLWPEAYAPIPGAKQKDAAENYLHKQICTGTITLEEAQDQISTDWYAVYKKLISNLGGINSINDVDEDDN